MMMTRKNPREMPASTRRIAAVIKGLMAERGVTQQQIADAIHRGQPYVSDRVKAKDAFNTMELELIAERLGITGGAFALLDEVQKRSGQ